MQHQVVGPPLDGSTTTLFQLSPMQERVQKGQVDQELRQQLHKCWLALRQEQEDPKEKRVSVCKKGEGRQMDLIKVSCWCTAEEWAVRCDTVLVRKERGLVLVVGTFGHSVKVKFLKCLSRSSY